MTTPKETREMALQVLREQAGGNESREEVVQNAFHAGVCAINTVEYRAEIIEQLEAIRDDETLERGVRKVAGWHLEALTVIRDTLAREAVTA